MSLCHLSVKMAGNIPTCPWLGKQTINLTLVLLAGKTTFVETKSLTEIIEAVSKN